MINRFLDYITYEKNYSRRTVGTYRDDLVEFCEFIGTKPEAFDPNQVRESDIKSWVIHLMESGRNGKRNAPRSVKQKVAALHSLYRFLLRIGAVKRDITLRIQTPKLDKPLPAFFKPSEMQRATAYEQSADDNESIRDNLIVEMLYQTGMRQAEMLALTDEQVDTQAGQIRVFGKRRKERLIPIGDNLCRLIEQYRQVRPDCLTAFFVHWQKDGSAVPLTKSRLYRIVIGRMGEVSTLRKHSPHVLRHTFATTMLENGADLRTIQQLLGHASLAATQIYTHTTFEQIRQTYQNTHPRSLTLGNAPR